MRRYGKYKLLVNWWLAQIDLVSSGGPSQEPKAERNHGFQEISFILPCGPCQNVKENPLKLKFRCTFAGLASLEGPPEATKSI